MEERYAQGGVVPAGPAVKLRLDPDECLLAIRAEDALPHCVRPDHEHTGP